MATIPTEIPACSVSETELAFSTTPLLAETVREGLGARPKRLPPWLFYDEAGSLLFEAITRLKEYYPTRIERAIFSAHAAQMLEAAAEGHRLRLLELGAGSAEKTRLILAAAAARQDGVEYCPVDVSASALEAARERLGRELSGVAVRPLVADYTQGLFLDPCPAGERRLVLWIGSSIGNFTPEEARRLLADLHASLAPGDGLLLGVDLAPAKGLAGGKTEAALMAAYDDAEGVTASFNRNLLARLNRELGADFDLEAFRHRVRWNRAESRIEMHLESVEGQTVRIAALEMQVPFAAGETIHTENSYKYRPGEAEELLRAAAFDPVERWRDADGWFAVYLAMV